MKRDHDVAVGVDNKGHGLLSNIRNVRRPGCSTNYPGLQGLVKDSREEPRSWSALRRSNYSICILWGFYNM
jgi:hypothetical protein